MKRTHDALGKCPTGIAGLDEITRGGFPKGRPSLVSGGPGCGKTVLAMEFLTKGITEYDEPGVFMAFEESENDLIENFSSLGFRLKEFTAKNKLVIDHVYIERTEIEETGEYDLEGLFVRLNYAIDSIGAKRVVLDTIEALFSGLTSTGILRAELRRLFRWLKTKGVTAVITAERGESTLTRYGLEEYVADCVLVLDHRVVDQISTRRMRLVKYRGSSHGMNEYPFLIDEDGISVLPITSLGLNYQVTNERISAGNPQLDAMLGGKGFYKGSAVLVSGTAGTGKTTVAAAFAEATCRSEQKSLYFAFEESTSQIIRNMRSAGIDLKKWQKKGVIDIQAMRPSTLGIEMHLVQMHNIVKRFDPSVVIVDPITNLMSAGLRSDVKMMLTRLIDFLKMRNITVMFTSLTSGEVSVYEQTDVGISSLMDTWLLLTNTADGGERVRKLNILKSRGMQHSNRVATFTITNKGLVIDTGNP